MGAKLEPDTRYHIVFQGTGDSDADLTLALSASDYQIVVAGWTIEDAYRLNEAFSGTNSVKIGVYGVENSAPTGEPTISGDPFAGRTLAADTDAIMDADGLDNVSYSYQWVRVDDDGISNATPITGETGSSYTLTPDDAGKRIRVRVSFTDDNLVPEERTSEAYPATGTVIDDTLISNLAETTHTSSVAVGNRSGTQSAQGFGTGSHDGNFLLTGVSVHINGNNFSGAETATFKIYDSDSDGTPKDELHALTPPDALTADNLTGVVFFAAPVGAKLEPDTNYHLVFQGTGSSS